ncbi:MAG TPA: hypothetical protein VL282_16815 [Tepidisphaeraceae bacterium]|jgi:hypothetical protein|nr:hypothetical protein [Tepidisphaeraceae bacterium]
MTEPLNYATPVGQKTPLIAWISIALAGLALLIAVFAVYFVRSTSMAITTTTTGSATSAVLFSTPPPVWVRGLQVLALGLPVIGLILAIVAVRRVPSNKAAAIVGIVLNAMMLCGLLLVA